MQTSAFRFYSWAIAASDKQPHTIELEVTPTETLPDIDGPIDDKTNTVTLKGVDRDGKAYTSSVDIGNSYTAYWLPLAGTAEPPAIAKGERVILMRAGDSPVIYWISTNQDTNYRKLESHTLALKAVPEDNEEEPDSDNSYVWEISPKNKGVTLSTSDRNGEVSRLTIQWDGRFGTYVIKDSIGQTILLDGPEHRIMMENVDGTIVDLNKENIIQHCQGNMSIKAGKNISMKAGDNVTVDAGTKVGIKTKSVEVKAPESKFSGNVGVGGKLDVAGALSFASASGGGGSFSVDGDGNIRCNNVKANDVEAQFVHASNLKYK